jgi:hypothetical protein
MTSNSFVPLKELRYVSSYPPELIIGNCFKSTKTKAPLRNRSANYVFVSHIKPKSFLEAKKNENCILAMQDKQNQFKRNDV